VCGMRLRGEAAVVASCTTVPHSHPVQPSQGTPTHTTTTHNHPLAQVSFIKNLAPIDASSARALDFQYRLRAESLLAVDDLIERVVKVREAGRMQGTAMSVNSTVVAAARRTHAFSCSELPRPVPRCPALSGCSLPPGLLAAASRRPPPHPTETIR